MKGDKIMGFTLKVTNSNEKYFELLTLNVEFNDSFILVNEEKKEVEITENELFKIFKKYFEEMFES